MKSYKVEFRFVCVCFTFIVGLFVYHMVNDHSIDKKVTILEVVSNDSIRLDTFSEANLNIMMNLLEIEHPEVVINQARLETGHYTSKRFRDYNGLFGFQSSDTEPIKYKTWKESVIAYKAWQMKRLRQGENYYSFLVRIKYASDSNYIPKLKRLCIK